MTGDHLGVPGLGDAPFNVGGRRATRNDDHHDAPDRMVCGAICAVIYRSSAGA